MNKSREFITTARSTVPGAPCRDRSQRNQHKTVWGATVPEKWPNRPWHSLFSTKCSVWNQAMNKWSEDKLLFWGWATRGKTWEGIPLLQAGFSWAAAGTLLLLSLCALRINPNPQWLPKSAKSKVSQATADPRSNLGAPSLPPGALPTPPRRMDYRDFLLTVHCLKVCVIHVLILPPAPKQNLDVEALL